MTYETLLTAGNLTWVFAMAFLFILLTNIFHISDIIESMGDD